jgi:hypothetical protein
MKRHAEVLSSPLLNLHDDGAVLVVAEIILRQQVRARASASRLSLELTKGGYGRTPQSGDSRNDRGRPQNVKDRVAVVRSAMPKRSPGERGSEVPRLRDQQQVYDKCPCPDEQFGDDGPRGGSSTPLKASVGSSPQRDRKRVSAEESIECLGRSRHRRRRPSTRSFKDGQPISTLSQAAPRDDTWIGLISRFRSSVASRRALVRALILSSVGSSSRPVGGVDTG